MPEPPKPPPAPSYPYGRATASAASAFISALERDGFRIAHPDEIIIAPADGLAQLLEGAGPDFPGAEESLAAKAARLDSVREVLKRLSVRR